MTSVPAKREVSRERRAFRTGVRDSVPFAIASALVAVSFGAVARDAGLTGAWPVVMSAVVAAGSAQFAAVAVVAQGGSIVAAILAGALMNSRYLPMGIALAPSLRGGRIQRALEGQAVFDASWAMAARGDGTFDRPYLFGGSAMQYVGWVGGTAVGVVATGLVADPRDLGLDAVFPAFFVALLASEIRNRRMLFVAFVGGALALALVPFVPPGVPILAASAVALVGLAGRR